MSRSMTSPRNATAVVTAAVLFWIANGPHPIAQTSSAARPAFEVASVKPNNSGDPRGGRLQPGGFTQTNITLQQLIGSAYGENPRRIVGGPSWINSDRFDVVAKGDFDLAGFLPSTDGSAPVVYRMLQTLLTERFSLIVHTETRDLPIYALLLANRDQTLGPRLRRSDVDCAAVTAAVLQSGRPPAPASPGSGPPCSMSVGPGRLIANAVDLSRLAGSLSSSVDRSVVDQTGLSGNFDIELEWAPDLPPAASDPPATGSGSANDGVSIFTALQEQLGLKLEPRQGPVKVLVVDRAEQPTPD